MKTTGKFLNDLYTIKRVMRDGKSNKMTIEIKLNPSNEIFKGHFPGDPILPGACTVQILKELLIGQTGRNLILTKAAFIKYLSFINPEVNSIINFDIEIKEIENNRILCDASVHSESVVFCRFKGEFGPIQLEEKRITG
jgi:3-hydroxyacyl-[acyl-carrier-protein] dehydratase